MGNEKVMTVDEFTNVKSSVKFKLLFGLFY